MDLRQLEYFVQIAGQGGFNRAAASLNVAQSALSRQMRQLEEELGLSLLVRTGRGVRLTPAGELLLSKTRVLLRHVREVRDEVIAEATVPRGELVVGMPPSLQSMLTVPLLHELRRLYPAVFPRLWVATSMVLRDLVLAGEMDLAVLGVVEPEGLLDSTPLFRDDMFLVGPPGSDAGSPDPVGWADVAARPLILTSRPNGVRLLVDRAAAGAGQSLTVAMEVNYVPVLLDLVRDGLGHTLLPYSAVHHLVEAGDLSAVRIADLSCPWVIVSSKEKPLSAAGRQARELLLRLAKRRVLEEGWPGASLGNGPRV